MGEGEADGERAVCVLGAGVSGVTTALVLTLLGWPVRVVAEAVMVDDAATHIPPTFASMFPAASIIPHTVSIADGGWHIETSSRFFAALSLAAGAGVRRQRHYEVFEQPMPIPEYAGWLDGFRSLQDTRELPRRTGAKEVTGWSFDIFFAEMPAYKRWLAQVLLELDVSVESPHRVTMDTIRNMPETVIVNCTGYGSAALFGVEDELTLVKGVVVKAGGDTSAFFDRNRLPVSYNYTPLPSVYPVEDGTSGDVYCYPRVDACVLGGTRLEGRLNAFDQWVGEEPCGPTVRIDGIDVPRPIIDLNRELIQSTAGVDIAGWPTTATVGYRCVRKAARGGVRLEAERVDHKFIVHNYGHGGAGVTYSWGSAVRVAQLIRSRLPPSRAVTGGDRSVMGALRRLASKASEG